MREILEVNIRYISQSSLVVEKIERPPLNVRHDTITLWTSISTIKPSHEMHQRGR